MPDGASGRCTSQSADNSGCRHVHPCVHLLFPDYTQGECIVITVGKENRISLSGYRVQVVLSEIAACIAVAAVVVVPCLAYHLHGHQQADYTAKIAAGFSLIFLLRYSAYGCHSQSNPDSKCIERTGVCIVSVHEASCGVWFR